MTLCALKILIKNVVNTGKNIMLKLLWKNHISPFLFFLLLLSFLISTPIKAEAGTANEELKIGVMPSTDYLPLALAEREKVFDQLGIRVKLMVFYSANERDAAFQSKRIDGSIIDYTGAMLQKSGGVDLKITSRCDGLFYLVTSPKLRAEKISDLKGKRIAVSQNTVIDYFVDQSLNFGGISGKDIEKVEVNRIPIRYELLLNNQIEGAGLPNPLAKIAENNGAKILLSNKDLNLSITGLAFHTESIEKKEEQIRKLYEAYAWGVDYIKNHSIKDMEDILIKRLAFTSETLDKKNLPEYQNAQAPDKKSLLAVKNWLVEKNLLKENFDLEDMLDQRFIKQ